MFELDPLARIWIKCRLKILQVREIRRLAADHCTNLPSRWLDICNDCEDIIKKAITVCEMIDRKLIK